jgi:hypothetical protein
MDIEEAAQQIRDKWQGQDADWDRPPQPKRGQAGFIATVTAYPPEDIERFATKLSRAVKARAAGNSMSRKQHNERVERERERNRYKPFQRRQHSKSE